MAKRRYPIVQDRVIDEQQIIPRRGGIYRLCGSGFAGKTMRVYAEAWTAMALMNGQYVHWIDGACRFNPARVLACFPDTYPNANDLLHNLFIGRGFTVHQFTSLIDRVANELAITMAKLIIVDGPIVMHLDAQVKDREARTLLKRSIDKLNEIAVKNDVAVIVITAAKAHSKRHKMLLDIIDNYCNQSLMGRRRKIGNRRKMWLIHRPSGSCGFREEWQEQETLKQSYSRILHQQLWSYSNDEIEELVLID
ncbi:MAG: hypothetical protein VX483_01695 [Candidatus Thermoplasmatota archaeon]|nr:hypothetical protein [Candidatus Thermoplasmatota archaeon]